MRCYFWYLWLYESWGLCHWGHMWPFLQCHSSWRNNHTGTRNWNHCCGQLHNRGTRRRLSNELLACRFHPNYTPPGLIGLISRKWYPNVAVWRLMNKQQLLNVMNINMMANILNCIAKSKVRRENKWIYCIFIQWFGTYSLYLHKTC